MNGPGTILQQTRLEKNLTIDKVHKDTKIKEDYLVAIEKDDVSAFPAEIYYKNFLKFYSRYLMLDAAEMLNIYEQVKIEKHQEYLKKNRTYSMGEKLAIFYRLRKKSIRFILTAIAAAVLAFIALNIFNRLNIKALTEDIENFMPQEQKEQNIIDGGSAVIDVTNTENEENSKEKEKKILPEELTLTVKTKYGTWVRIISDKNVIFEGILKRGQNFSAKAKDGFLLKIGNIEGVEVLFNNEIVDVKKGADANKVNTIILKRD